MEWQKIETAPRDGTAILVWAKTFAGEISGIRKASGVEIAAYSDGTSDHAGSDWWDCLGGEYYSTWVEPTHWMPLPNPPITD